MKNLTIFLLAMSLTGGALQAEPSRREGRKVAEVPAAIAAPVCMLVDSAGEMHLPGPVVGHDPYFTLKIGEAEVYRDALDPTLAYYRPVFGLAKRKGTPLDGGAGPLEEKLEAFRLEYFRFESGGSPKWGRVQVVIRADRPEGLDLQRIQEVWKDVTRLQALPFRFPDSQAVRLRIPFPPHTVHLSEFLGEGGEADHRWFAFSTSDSPTPERLLAQEDNDLLNESETRALASLLASDLGELPAFQGTLEIRTVYDGWSGSTPYSRARSDLLLPGAGAKDDQSERLVPLMDRLDETEDGEQAAKPPVRPVAHIPTGRSVGSPGRFKGTTGVTRQPSSSKSAFSAGEGQRLQAGLPSLGPLAPRQDISYAFSFDRVVDSRLRVGFPQSDTPLYDYYFLSDSGRLGGPFLEPSPLPDRPRRAAPPGDFAGYWYESHWLGRRLVWPAPRGFRLRWETDGCMRPSCVFMLGKAPDGKLLATIEYRLYPDFSPRQMTRLAEELSRDTGETVEFLPFTDLIDANHISLGPSSPGFARMVDDKQVSVTKLTPRTLTDAWFRVRVDMPVVDWASFTLFMKLGELGSWDVELLTAAESGSPETVAFAFNGNLLETMGGAVVPGIPQYEADSGLITVPLENYGVGSLTVRGLRFQSMGAGSRQVDSWFMGDGWTLPGIESFSSFDQLQGAGGCVTTVVTGPAPAAIREMMATEDSVSLSVELASDMLAPGPGAGVDPDVEFSFVRSLCYRLVNDSELVKVPVALAEQAQWADLEAARVVLRYQGFVYSASLEPGAAALVAVRRLPLEGAFAVAKGPDGDLLEYRAEFVRMTGERVVLPPSGSGSKWMEGSLAGVILDPRFPSRDK